jgi:hypothetical protein
LLSRVLRAQEHGALQNSKIEEKKAISVAEHLAEGLSTKGTSRLVGVSAQTIRRLRRGLGDHSREFHDERVSRISRAPRYRWRSVTGVCQEQEGAFLGSDLNRSPKPAADRLRRWKKE